jgi:hypothetical protein
MGFELPNVDSVLESAKNAGKEVGKLADAASKTMDDYINKMNELRRPETAQEEMNRAITTGSPDKAKWVANNAKTPYEVQFYLKKLPKGTVLPEGDQLALNAALERTSRLTATSDRGKRADMGLTYQDLNASCPAAKKANGERVAQGVREGKYTQAMPVYAVGVDVDYLYPLQDSNPTLFAESYPSSELVSGAQLQALVNTEVNWLEGPAAQIDSIRCLLPKGSSLLDNPNLDSAQLDQVANALMTKVSYQSGNPAAVQNIGKIIYRLGQNPSLSAETAGKLHAKYQNDIDARYLAPIKGKAQITS